jgi:multidrug efflux pump
MTTSSPTSFNLSAWAVRHQALVLFLILITLVSGAFAFVKLGRGEDPNFTIKVAIVSALWPGSTAIEMQDQVSDRIEKKLQELPYFHKVQTYTKPGFAAMMVEFKDYTPAKQMPELFYQLRKKLSDIRGDLPRDLIGPMVNDEYGDVDSILYMLTGDGADYARMKDVAEALRQHLLRVPNVVKVNIPLVSEELALSFY